MTDQIQEGVYFRPGERPPDHFAIAFLTLSNAPDPIRVRGLLDDIWNTIERLKSGDVADLPGQPFDPKNLSAFLGFGSSFFRRLALDSAMPPELKRFRPPKPDGGGSVSLGSGLNYGPDVMRNPADAAISLQFTGDSALSVRRAVVEVWKTIENYSASHGSSPLILSGSYTGFGREDKRSWIDFFDGTSNMRSDQRLAAIQIKERSIQLPDKWKEGGTFLCFMRIRVALKSWKSLSRADQEILVGRDKLTGCPLVVADDGTGSTPIPGCPFSSGGNVEDGENEQFRFASRPAGSQELRNSHIHRANQGRSTSSDPESRLVFRQGYEFLDGIDEDGNPVLGLNFVSFQDTPERILGMLKLPGWLGNVNFGGDEANQPPGMDELLTVFAAGFFVSAPVSQDGKFPGREIFSISDSLT